MNHVNKKIITRFPPSPTGSLHIGNIRTLLFNYLFTRQNNGEIVMRFEDTDRERSNREHEQVALDALESLGLDFDKGPFRQSERTEKYVEALENLIKNNKAYVAEESQGEEGSHVIRFRNPNKRLTFTDIIRGEITIDTTDFGDFVIARSRTNPLYHLTVVVDDEEMGITHVIRGEDHITSTPRQILLIEALGANVPNYAHLPLIIGNDKKKLGKRHGAVTYQEFEALGYIPAGIINYLALLGWNPGDNREFFTKDELIKEFSLEKVNNSPAMFSYEKLDSINKYHMLQLSDTIYEQNVLEFLKKENESQSIIEHPQFSRFVTIVLRDRLNKFSEVRTLFSDGEFLWFTQIPSYKKELLLWKDSSISQTIEHLTAVSSILKTITEWTPENIKDAVWQYADKNGIGEVLWPLRFALTGQKRSPDPFVVSSLLGKEESIKRIHSAIDLL